jgi:hypothetical protein
MKHELEPIGSKVIFSQACKATPLGLEWVGEPSHEELLVDDYIVQRCDQSVGWWMGDLVVKLWRKEGADMSLNAFATKYAQVRGLSEQAVQQRAHVAAFFPLVERSTKPVAWSHHYIVWCMVGGEGLDVCAAWLKRAHAGEWSTGRLRRELAAENLKAQNPEPPPPKGLFDELAPFDSWAASALSDVEKMDADRARRVLDAMKCVVAFVDALKRRARNG